MLEKVADNREFREMMRQHIEQTMFVLFENSIEFGIYCDFEHISFDPELPEYITENFEQATLFLLAGYTYESARVESDMLIFEAGFGEENIGSLVTVPLLSIMQIIVDGSPILINIAQHKAQTTENSEQNSMEALLSNPKNRKFLQ